MNTQDDSHLYDMLQPTMIRAQNRYADAYMVPELDTLDQFTSNDVTASTHVDVTGDEDVQAIIDLIDGHSPSFRGTAAPGSETPFFWVVYVSTAFQGKLGYDGDPDVGSNDLFGCTSGVGGEIALVFLEPIRDQVTWNTTLPRNPEALLRAMVTVHEIGHEFGLDHITGGATTSIMSMDASTIPDAEFYFSAKSINDLRNTSTSP